MHVHKPAKYIDKALSCAASAVWVVFEMLNRIKPNPSFKPKWSDKPLLKSWEKTKPQLGWPRTTDSLCPKCVPEIRQEILDGKKPLSALTDERPGEIKAQWHTIDATGQILGRLASKIAIILQGKHKPTYTPHVDTGDFVIVINAEKVRLTGKKEEQKSYMSFSGYVGGHKSESVRARRARHPELLIERAVRGMIPHNRLGRHVYRKLKVYRGNSHPHAAQQPETVKLAARKS